MSIVDGRKFEGFIKHDAQRPLTALSGPSAEARLPADPSVKDPNPKDSVGSSKAHLHLWPEIASLYGSMALLDGALKYGRGNFLATEVRASIYYDALKRHMAAWFEGREADPDSGLPDLAHALACLAILVSSEAAGTLIDDRAICGGYLDALEKMTPLIKKLQDKHADKTPRHYTIKDNK